MSDKKKPVVIIRRCPVDTFSYFQWLLTGLYQLEQEGKIKLRFKISLLDKMSLFWFNNKYISGGIRRILNRFRKVPRYNLFGEIRTTDGKRKSFAVDPKDSPFIFTVSDLKKCDAYFKLQCPIEINPEGFEIARNVHLPWQDVVFEENEKDYSHVSRKVASEIIAMKEKIHPGMVGPRRLGWSCRKSVLLSNFNKYLSDFKPGERKKLTAYFGGATFPAPTKCIDKYDFDWESDLMAFLGDDHSHPNEKREKSVRIMRDLANPDFDGRLITDRDGNKHHDLVIPLEDFCNYLSGFEYNLNISGFRLSIPNRFIESFMVGTAIVTDRLSVRWYMPFEDEVIESVKMGYEHIDRVDWEAWEREIQMLPETDPETIRKRFMEKWYPSAFASYIIETTLKS